MVSKFGEEFNKIWPTSEPEYSQFGRKLLADCQQLKKPAKPKLSALIENSSKFPVKFPINSCRILSQPQVRHPVIEQQAATAYPVIHSRVLWLFLRFLEHKCKYGTRIEKEIYANLTLPQFVDRLLSKRCATFYNRNDKYLLISGERGASGFVEIGTVGEVPPLVLKNCLSYDEIKLSALLSVSSHSEFLNDGTRKNLGEIERDERKFEREGVIVGFIGARLSRRDLMEFQDIVISKSQNTAQNGYGSRNPDHSNPTIEKKRDFRQIWNEFYNEQSFLFSQVTKDGKRFGDSRNKDDIFDNLVMKKRYMISFDTLLLESEDRAAKAKKQAYIHVVGIGLGVWRTSNQQEAIFLETFTERIKELLPKLKHVSYIHFSWFQLSEWQELKSGKLFESKDHPNGGIRILISKRNPAEKLVGPEFKNTLLVVSYPWDGNALPGNEFWMGMLSSTGDPAAACSTLITELHNPHINDKMVSGNNLHIASSKLGVIHIAEYAQKL